MVKERGQGVLARGCGGGVDNCDGRHHICCL